MREKSELGDIDKTHKRSIIRLQHVKRLEQFILHGEDSAMGAGLLLIILLTPWWVWLIVGVVATILITLFIKHKRKQSKTKIIS